MDSDTAEDLVWSIRKKIGRIVEVMTDALELLKCDGSSASIEMAKFVLSKQKLLEVGDMTLLIFKDVVRLKLLYMRNPASHKIVLNNEVFDPKAEFRSIILEDFGIDLDKQVKSRTSQINAQ